MNGGTSDPDDAAETAEIEDVFDRLFRDGRTNALIAWALVAVLAGVFVDSVVDVDLQWVLFTAFVAGVVLLPPVVYREWRDSRCSSWSNSTRSRHSG